MTPISRTEQLVHLTLQTQEFARLSTLLDRSVDCLALEQAHRDKIGALSEQIDHSDGAKVALLAEHRALSLSGMTRADFRAESLRNRRATLEALKAWRQRRHQRCVAQEELDKVVVEVLALEVEMEEIVRRLVILSRDV
ncbi:hypothetical protein RQP46_006563 [Phenoliferia psychrophenolica]